MAVSGRCGFSSNPSAVVAARPSWRCQTAIYINENHYDGDQGGNDHVEESRVCIMHARQKISPEY